MRAADGDYPFAAPVRSPNSALPSLTMSEPCRIRAFKVRGHSHGQKIHMNII